MPTVDVWIDKEQEVDNRDNFLFDFIDCFCKSESINRESELQSQELKYSVIS